MEALTPIAVISIFTLSVFVGFEVVSKVSSTLHTPLMSGANAIHGVILVGAIIVASHSYTTLELTLSVIAIILATLALAPLLKYWGAASTYADAILFFGSLSAQILMVYQKFESWIIWLIVDAGYVALYASQDLLFTSVLYITFTVLAAMGWSKWYGAHRSATRSL